MSPETREKEGRQSQSESLSPSLFAGLLCVSASLLYLWASLVAQTVKNLPAMQETRFDPWVRKIPWRREWQPTLVFLPGEFHGQRSLVSYRPLGHKESYMTEQLTKALIRLVGGGTLPPSSDVCVRSFPCPFFTLIKLCYTKALE